MLYTLPEAGLLAFHNPQRVTGLAGKATRLADHNTVLTK